MTPTQTTSFPIPRYFTQFGQHPYDLIDWDIRTARITKDDGTIVFEQPNIEVPSFWSETASNVTASKYFRGQLDSPDRECSVKTMFDRVVNTIAEWGFQDAYFADRNDSETFKQELKHILVHQMASFNSPVWFNIGTPNVPQQASACFLIDVEDTMDSILNWYHEEALIFKGGSGSGLNASKIRSKHEGLSGGGQASGVLSFMKAADASAGVIQSGGKNRRAAKMVILDMDHPEIEDFIWCKVLEERKARALIAMGYDASIDGEAYRTVAFQNTNHSVNASNEFLQKAIEGGIWFTHNRTSSQSQHHDAAYLLRQIAEACHASGDPGMQFTDTINAWHTCPNSGLIGTCNPCCFVGETLVDSSEGQLRFDELHEIYERGDKLPLVFAHDRQTNLPVLRPIKKVWVAGHTRTLLDVKTDKGICVRCTPEHRFLLRDGRYVEARHLQPGMRLRKIARWRNKERRNCAYINHRCTEDHANGTVHQARFMWEQIHGPIPKGYDVHHVNEDCMDDRLSNLELKETIQHKQEYSKGVNNPRFKTVSWNSLVEVWEAIEAMPKGTHNAKGQATVTPNRWNKYIRANDLVGSVPWAGSPTYGGRIQGMSWVEFAKAIAEHREDVNDTIASVEAVYLDQRVPVYDMEVEGTQNFAVTDGELHSIIVHNSEYYFLNYTACNLASLNLLKFLKPDNSFDIEGFCHTVDVLITAMDILVGRADYPTPAITQNSHDYRTLGLGYANLGALLMAKGLPYDSKEGRDYAASITALMTGKAYKRSAQIAEIKGPFAGFTANRDFMIDVIMKHEDAVNALSQSPISDAAKNMWETAFMHGSEVGYRNAQVTLLAPTGTISIMMDCATTGVEPDIGLVNYKALVGGGTIKKVNPIVERALKTLGYNGTTAEVLKMIETDGGPYSIIREEHIPVFDCALPATPGGRSISWQGHVRMVGALQPFLSGGISKSCNMPNDATVEDIEKAYLLAWKLGCKSIAIYRDGCKQTQVLTTQKPVTNTDSLTEDEPETVGVTTVRQWRGQLTEEEANDRIETRKEWEAQRTQVPPIVTEGSRHSTTTGVAEQPDVTMGGITPQRKRLPDERPGFTHKFSVGGQEGYFTVNVYEDTGQPAELFVHIAKEGSTLGGVLDAWATMVSFCLQYGVPLKALTSKLRNARYEPMGFTSHPDIHTASSLTDYIAQWLDLKFGDVPKTDTIVEPLNKNEVSTSLRISDNQRQVFQSLDSPLCMECGSQMARRAGSCWLCTACGSTSGACG